MDFITMLADEGQTIVVLGKIPRGRTHLLIDIGDVWNFTFNIISAFLIPFATTLV